MVPRRALTSHLEGGGVPLGGWKPWPCLKPLGTQKIHMHPVTIYLTKNFSYAYPVLVRTDSLFCCVSSYIHKNLLHPARTIAGAVIAGLSGFCHKHCGLGSNPVINGVVRQYSVANLDILCQWWWPQNHTCPAAARPRHRQYGSAPPPPPDMVKVVKSDSEVLDLI